MTKARIRSPFAVHHSSFLALALAASIFSAAHAAEPRYRDLVLADKPAA